jgi:hypothetical protein
LKNVTILLGLAILLPATSHAFTASGRFLYEDRMWDKDGYTGQVQNLPIRHAKVEIVNVLTQQALATGATDDNGNFSLQVTGQLLPVSAYARCSTDGRTAGYEIRVVDELERGLGEPAVVGNIHAIMTDPVIGHNPATDLSFGTYLIQDTDGTGVAQAFNVFDNAVDFFDWLARPALNNALPAATQYIIYAWSPIGTNEGSNYSGHAILLSSPGQGNDTDGWSDTVILHETGHWFDDFYSRSDNPGGAHFLGDNNAEPRLAYGEGVATFHCSKVRKLRSETRFNLNGQPIDNHVSTYGDLMIPPDVGTPGALSFSYDFETGVAFQPGLPPGGFFLGQRGTANETNVTSAQWDLVDGPGTKDETPGVDDDGMQVADTTTWAIEHTYLPSIPSGNIVTVEDYYQGWFAQHGAGFMKPQVDHVFVDLALMEFYEDTFEPDNTTANAPLVVTQPYTVSPTGHVVLNEFDLGSQDAIELFNGGTSAVDMTGWQLQVYVNGDTAPVATRIFAFPPFTLNPGEVVAVYERGDQLNNGTYHLYAGDTPVSFNASWNWGLDGACVIRNATGTAIDFVRWKDADGVENTTPTPAGLSWTGSLPSPTSPSNLARDLGGTDTDNASDFSEQGGTLGSVNYLLSQHHTLYSYNDQDLIAFQATAGRRYGFEAKAFFSASDPYLEILSPSGGVLGSNDNNDVGVTDARIDFLAGTTGTYYLKVRHVGTYTDWAVYNLVALERPVTSTSLAPGGVTASADNASDANDVVHLQWLNGSSYDSVRVYRGGAVIVTLAGSPSAWDDQVPRGVYQWEVSGFVDGTETAKVSTYEFAGIITCTAQDDFESGNANNWESDPNTWGVTPFAKDGTWAFTDSPIGVYDSCPASTTGCTLNRSAIFRVPAFLPPGSHLTFDQICITEHCEGTPCDICVVEISTDEGTSWTELARYDQASDPGWADNVADPTDWRPADIDLSDYALERVLIRLRLQSDPLLSLDGWYVDNLKVNDNECSLSDAGIGPVPVHLEFLPPAPNPMRSSARLSFVLPKDRDEVGIAIFDVAGRVVRKVSLGPTPAGSHTWVWDGRTSDGVSVSSGVYFARLDAGQVVTRKILKVAN